MSQPYLGEIRMFCGNFAPRGWALCNGQLLAIQQYAALFSILGTTYGGNGTTTFAIPNLQGRVAMHWGSGAGLTTRVIGESAGNETVTLLSTQMPAHTHTVGASTNAGGRGGSSPTSNVPAVVTPNTTEIYAAGPPNTTMNAQMINTAGGSQPHQNLQPYLCVTFIIATSGIFPTRN